MTVIARPYSPETLAHRWGCSAEQVRRMFHAGKLGGFRIGKKLIRIPAAEVERYECQNTALHATEDSLPSHGEKVSAVDESRLVRLTEGLPKLAPVKSGTASPLRKANG